MTRNGCRYCNAQPPASAIARESGREEGALCVLHDTDEHKNAALFAELIRVKLDEGDNNFSGFVFPPGTSDFSDRRFKTGADFSSAIFLGKTCFRRAQFEGAAADFTGAIFHSGADFNQAVFECDTVFFSRSSFSGAPANFNSAGFFAETTNFSGTRFGAGADFSSAVFHGSGAYFTESIFAGGKADFSNTVFRARKTAFRWARFCGETDFSNAQFDGLTAHFQQTLFSGGPAKFDSAKFRSRILNFSDSRFRAGCSFSGAQFGGEEADFRDVRFAGEIAGFGGATFACKGTSFKSASFSAARVDFSCAEISGIAMDFRKAVFSGISVTFAGARFLDGKTEFPSADFSTEQPPSFLEAVFTGPISFRSARFRRGARFERARFLGETDFSGVDFSTIPGARIEFMNAHFAGAFASFESVDLRQTFFAGAILDTQIYARRARWPSIRYFLRLRKRATCADERHAREPEEHRRAADTLKMLEQSMRKSGSSKLAGDFAFSAFECNRKARPAYSPLRFSDLLFGAWMSGYGQKMCNIILFSVAIILGSALILTFTGEGLSAPAHPDGGPVSIVKTTILYRFGLCLGRSITAFFCAGLIKLQPTTLHGSVLLKIESFLGLLLILAFFVILMRRALLFPKARR